MAQKFLNPVNLTNTLQVNGAEGTNGQVLTSSGAGVAPTWTTVSGGSSSPMYFFGNVSGMWTVYPQGNTGQGTQQIFQGNVFYQPILVNQTTTFDRISLNVSTVGTAGSVIRLGLYNNNGNKPSTLVADFGTVAGTTAGEVMLTINQTVSAGIYWIALVGQGAPTTQPILWRAAGTMPLFPTNNASFASRYQLQFSYMVSGVTGALPSTATVNTATNGDNRTFIIQMRAV